jgi:hypothetical protein
MQTQNDMLVPTTPVQNTAVPPTQGGIYKSVDDAGKVTFSDRKGAAGVAYTPGTPALGKVSAGLSMNPSAATPFTEQVTTSYTPKPISSISAARSQLSSYQKSLSDTSDQMSQAAVSGIKPVTFGQTPVYRTGNSFSDRMS